MILGKKAFSAYASCASSSFFNSKNSAFCTSKPGCRGLGHFFADWPHTRQCAFPQRHWPSPRSFSSPRGRGSTTGSMAGQRETALRARFRAVRQGVAGHRRSIGCKVCIGVLHWQWRWR